MSDYPEVSIVFPNYNGGNEPIECLNSIHKLDYPKNKLEVIVVDNNSHDGSLQKIKDKSLKIKNQIHNFKIIENKKNVGFAKAINQGIKKSTGEYIFIGNDDLLFEKNSLKTLIDYITKHRKIGVLGGKIFSKENKEQIVSNGYMINSWTGNIYRSHVEDEIFEPDWIQGCAMLIPINIIKKIGFLDEGFSFGYFEDVDFCSRVKRAGFQVIYLPNALFWHGQSTTSNKYKDLKHTQWYKNKIRFVLKNSQFIQIISILTIQTLLITPYKLLILHDKQFIPFMRALIWNIAHLTETIQARKTKYLL